MYRFLTRCNGGVLKKSHSEGSTIHVSMFYERLTLCGRYLHNEGLSNWPPKMLRAARRKLQHKSLLFVTFVRVWQRRA